MSSIAQIQVQMTLRSIQNSHLYQGSLQGQFGQHLQNQTKPHRNLRSISMISIILSHDQNIIIKKHKNPPNKKNPQKPYPAETLDCFLSHCATLMGELT